MYECQKASKSCVSVSKVSIPKTSKKGAKHVELALSTWSIGRHSTLNCPTLHVVLENSAVEIHPRKRPKMANKLVVL